MKEIKWLAEQIEEELEDAENYAWKAKHYKDTDPDLSRTCTELARQEIKHSEMLHDQAVRLIKAFRSTGAEPPAVMLAVWEHEHDKMIKRRHKVDMLLSN